MSRDSHELRVLRADARQAEDAVVAGLELLGRREEQPAKNAEHAGCALGVMLYRQVELAEHGHSIMPRVRGLQGLADRFFSNKGPLRDAVVARPGPRGVAGTLGSEMRRASPRASFATVRRAEREVERLLGKTRQSLQTLARRLEIAWRSPQPAALLLENTFVAATGACYLAELAARSPARVRARVQPAIDELDAEYGAVMRLWNRLLVAYKDAAA